MNFIKHVLNWLISLVILISMSPLFLVYIPIIIVVIFADPYYDSRSSKGQILFAIFEGPIGILKKIYNKVHLK